MKIRHPLSGAIYRRLDDGKVEVEEPEGRGGAADGAARRGVFAADGRWLSGELHEADPHLLGFVGGPELPSRRRPAHRNHGVAVPRFETAGGRRGGRGGRSLEMDLGLEGKRALVTAASRGIGLATARVLAEQGCDVALCARGEAALTEAHKDLESRGAKVFSRCVDVADGEALKAFVTAAGEALGGLDVFVANASAGGGPGEAAWQANFDVDVMGAVRGVDAALPFLEASEAASIVFIASTAALEFLGMPQAYNAMKAALIAHASDLSQSLAGRGIRVNAVSPGPVQFEGGNWEMIQQTMPAVYQRALAQCAIGRMGTPEEVARTVVFLASPAASLVTGSNLVVDGGFTKRSAF